MREKFQIVLTLPKLAMFAASLFFAQSLLLVHGVKYGDEAHDHNGIVCAIVVGCRDDGDALIPQSPIIPAPEAIFFALPRYFQVAPTQIMGAIFRNRSPPFVF